MLPEAVSQAPFDKVNQDTETESWKNKVSEDSYTGENYLTVDYTKLVPLLIEAVKEQQATIEALETRVQALENS